jgi:hypothetical protein
MDKLEDRVGRIETDIALIKKDIHQNTSILLELKDTNKGIKDILVEQTIQRKDIESAMECCSRSHLRLDSIEKQKNAAVGLVLSAVALAVLAMVIQP